MHLRYIHWFNNQGSNAVLKVEGFISDEVSEVEKKTKASLLLQQLQ